MSFREVVSKVANLKAQGSIAASTRRGNDRVAFPTHWVDGLLASITRRGDDQPIRQVCGDHAGTCFRCPDAIFSGIARRHESWRLAIPAA
jgi:hypothetical protein